MRVSNFLLWQIAYAEIWVTDTLWPDFRKRHLLEAILAYQKRDRRYGGITSRRRRGAPRAADGTRVLSALVLLPIVIGTVWFLPPVATLVLAAARRGARVRRVRGDRRGARRARARALVSARRCWPRASRSAAVTCPPRSS